MKTVPSTFDAFAPAHAMLAALRNRCRSLRASWSSCTCSASDASTGAQRHRRAGPDPRAAAAEADAARTRGDARALLGLPVTLKESMNVPGLPTTVGVPDFAEFRAEALGAVPRDVLGAGAVLLGKTNIAPCSPIGRRTIRCTVERTIRGTPRSRLAVAPAAERRRSRPGCRRSSSAATSAARSACPRRSAASSGTSQARPPSRAADSFPIHRCPMPGSCWGSRDR